MGTVYTLLVEEKADIKHKDAHNFLPSEGTSKNLLQKNIGAQRVMLKDAHWNSACDSEKLEA